MKLAARSLPLFLLSILALPAWADDSGNFIVRLGQDTTGVEHYLRTTDKIEVDQVGRAPRTLRRHFTYDLKGGALTHLAVMVTPPGGKDPIQSVDATVEGDSARVVIRNGAAPPSEQHLALPQGTLVIFGSSPWVQYEGQLMKLAKSKSDTLGGVLLFVGARNTDRFLLRKLGRDSVEISNTHLDVYRAAVDKAGHLLGITPISGTQKFSITRVAKLDVDAYANSFMAREQAGQGMGMLSPRDTVRVANAGGASLMIDYGRPGKRGRVVMGGLVPTGEVWRTGANAATQFRTDKALDFGGTVVPAGFYTLWSMYTGTSWKLIVNGETGQWGTEHKAAKDLFTIDMKMSTLPQVVERFTISVDGNDKGGVLNLDWDTTRASAAFTTQPSP